MVEKQSRLLKAVGYCRTSSMTNVGEGKDSIQRQAAAIEAYAEKAGYELVGGYYDEGVSGSTHLKDRPKFLKMMEDIAANGIDTIIIEDANRFARDLVVQLVGYDWITEQGIKLIAANSPDHFIEDSPTSTLVRNVLGAIAEFDKSQLVHRLKVARDRKTARGERGSGRLSIAEKLGVEKVKEIMEYVDRGLTEEWIAYTMGITRPQVYKVKKWVNENGMDTLEKRCS